MGSGCGCLHNTVPTQPIGQRGRGGRCKPFSQWEGIGDPFQCLPRWVSGHLCNVHLSREPSPDFSGPPFADSVVIYSYSSIETTYIVVLRLLLRSDEYDTTDMENASGLPLMCVPFSLILSPLCGLTRDNSVAFYSFRRHCLGRTHGGHVHEDRQDRSTGYCQ